MQENVNIFEEEYFAINKSLANLLRNANARAVLLIDRSGQLITSAGNLSTLDVPSIASLSAADFEAASLLASLVGEKNFSTLFHQGEKENIYASLVAARVIIIVIFDERTTLGLIRVRVKQTTQELSTIFMGIFRKLEIQGEPRAGLGEDFASEAEAEIENLFK